MRIKREFPLEEGDYYLSPEGYKVFTEQFHLKRGCCCKSEMLFYWKHSGQEAEYIKIKKEIL